MSHILPPGHPPQGSKVPPSKARASDTNSTQDGGQFWNSHIWSDDEKLACPSKSLAYILSTQFPLPAAPRQAQLASDSCMAFAGLEACCGRVYQGYRWGQEGAIPEGAQMAFGSFWESNLGLSLVDLHQVSSFEYILHLQEALYQDGESKAQANLTALKSSLP